MELLPQTRLTLVVQEADRTAEYLSFVLGHFDYGVCVTVPQILQQQFALLAGTQFHAYFVSGSALLEFEGHVLGYISKPPAMVISEPKQMTEKDRRRSHRVRVGLEVSYVLNGPNPIGEKTVTTDLSVGGMSIATTNLLPRGTALTVFLTVEDQVLAISSRVVWSEYRGKYKQAGIEFGELPDKQQAALAHFLFSLERMQAKPPSPGS